jgi:hypothetical protein
LLQDGVDCEEAALAAAGVGLSAASFLLWAALASLGHLFPVAASLSAVVAGIMLSAALQTFLALEDLATSILSCWLLEEALAVARGQDQQEQHQDQHRCLRWQPGQCRPMRAAAPKPATLE